MMRIERVDREVLEGIMFGLVSKPCRRTVLLRGVLRSGGVKRPAPPYVTTVHKCTLG